MMIPDVAAEGGALFALQGVGVDPRDEEFLDGFTPAATSTRSSRVDGVHMMLVGTPTGGFVTPAQQQGQQTTTTTTDDSNKYSGFNGPSPVQIPVRSATATQAARDMAAAAPVPSAMATAQQSPPPVPMGLPVQAPAGTPSVADNGGGDAVDGSTMSTQARSVFLTTATLLSLPSGLRRHHLCFNGNRNKKTKWYACPKKWYAYHFLILLVTV